MTTATSSALHTAAAEVLLDIDQGVATITLNAPDRLNALTVAMGRELVAAMDAVDADPSVGCLVVRGEGRAFCAGAHLGTLMDAGTDPAEPNNYADLRSLYQSFVRLGRVGCPTIASVRGAAVGAGMNLMLATDLRIVATDARLISGFLKRGLHPGGGHFMLLNRVAGREAAAAMAVFDEEVSGARAVQLGLAWEVVAPEDLDVRTLELARRVARDPELARAAVTSFRSETGASQMPWDVALQFERSTQMWSMRRTPTAR